jgi:hypothetical protein
MAGITRLNGSAQAGAFYGYQPRWFEVADTGYDTTPGIVESNYEKAVRAIESIATIVILGYPGTGGFMVAVDGNTFDGYTSGGTPVAAAAALEAVIEAAVPTCTVTEKTLGSPAFTGTGLAFITAV